MKENIQNHLGEHINHVKVVGIDTSTTHFNASRWIFQCDCGNYFSDIPSRVLSGHRKSCGCIKGKTSLTHGCNGNPFYPTWWSMMQRCYNESNHNFHRYGKRGITVCREWHNPQNFIDWATNTVGCKSSLTLDRIDNDKGYSPDNCRWVSMREQSNNRSSTRFETIDNVTMPFSYWCEKYNISPASVRARMKNGMPFKQALTEPLHKDHVMITLNGETKNISDWCKHFGISRRAVYSRIRNGWTPEKAVSTPTRK